MSKLVIVESPTKAKTIKAFLPKGVQVVASMGHVRDLPESASQIPEKYKKEEWSNLGVNVAEDFEPIYVIPRSKKKVIDELKEKLKNADELILATDEDREGESISWHLLQVLKPKVPVKRMVFHEITKDAIRDAMDHCRKIDENLVRAQETRRILDRLVGYTISPLLWKKIAYGLSGGRVQSVSVRLLVLRERERRAFRSGTYWDLKALLKKDGVEFAAQMVALDGKRLATGRDFDEHTGKIAKGKDVLLLSEADAKKIQQQIQKKNFTVATLEAKDQISRPSAPFITSTLQQEANRKLRLSARDTMRTAQELYENGFITYMRTDSVHLSEQAITAARSCVGEMYGQDYLSPEPRHFTSKSKNAQEAHEAIRPAGQSFIHPEKTGLSGRTQALYEMIWKRTVATQMADALQTFITVDLTVDKSTFRASGKKIKFAGFLRAYVEGSDDPDEALRDQEIPLPKLRQGDAVPCQGIESQSHETQPPARYTEASLVKELDAEGVGRPSTYASIIGTIIDRGYVVKAGNALVPTYTAFAVIQILEQHFPSLVDIGFTAKMEDTLDDIADGKAEWLPYLIQFYSGKEGLKARVDLHEGQIQPDEARTVKLSDLAAAVKVGRYGAYVELEKNGETLKASIPDNIAPADLDMLRVVHLIKQKADGPTSLGNHPASGDKVYVLSGRYGPYVQLGEMTDTNKKPRRTSLPRGMTLDQVTLEIALNLLQLPKELGTHPDGGKIVANIGRFGPYVMHDQGAKKDFRSLKKDDAVLTITLKRALEILAEPKKGRSRRSAKALRELGPHSGDQEMVAIFDGPYGPYIKHGKTNVSVPEGTKPEDVTMAQALELLAGKQKTKGKKKK